jgi:hypothetical protein
MSELELSEREANNIRKVYSRSVRLDFVVKSQPFICLNDLDASGGLAESATFYKAVDGKTSEFMFWMPKRVLDKSMAEYHFRTVIEKDGLNVDNAGSTLSEEKVAGKKRRFAYQHNTKSLVEGKYAAKGEGPLSYGILRLENDKGCCNTYGVEDIKDNDLPQIGKSEHIAQLSLSPFGLSRLAWLDAQGPFVKGDYVFDYAMVDKGAYTVLRESEDSKDLLFEGDVIKGIYRLNTADNQIEFMPQHDPEPSRIEQAMAKSYDLSKDDIKNVYDKMGIVVQDLGCVMLDVSPIKVSDVVPEDDLFQFDPDAPDYLKGYVSEQTAHVTLLYGFMESAQTYQPYIDELLHGLPLNSVKIDEVSFFPGKTPDDVSYYVLIAKVEVTDELKEANARMKMLPHIDTFPDYKPHITLAYIKGNDALRDKHISALNERLAGQPIAAIGLDYGDA